MKTQLDMDKIARALGAERRGKNHRVRRLLRGDAAPGGHRRALPRAVRRRPADGSPLDRAAARPAGTTNARATRADRGQDPGAWGRERRADATRGTSTREKTTEDLSEGEAKKLVRPKQRASR